MQLAVRAAILCACLCVAGIFLPAGQVSVRTPVSTHTRAASLYQLGARKDAAKARPSIIFAAIIPTPAR